VIEPALARRFVEIVANYSPDPDEARSIVFDHLRHADYISCAIQDNKVVGVLVTSSNTAQTPFARRRLPVIYQRMLFLDPSIIGRGIGVRLFVRSLYDQFGLLWPFRRFVLVCRTQSAKVARKMRSFSRVYPQLDRPVPAVVRSFAESMLVQLGATRLDDKFRLIGTLQGLEGQDYSEYWQRYLRSSSDTDSRLILDTAFYMDQGRVRNTGAFLLMIGYARPLALAGLLLTFLRPANVILRRIKPDGRDEAAG